jgi:hypothetical protein
MNASKTANPVTIAPAFAAAIFLAACESGQPPPRLAANSTTCDGRTSACLVAKSEMDGRRPAYVYIDGKMGGLILPNKTLKVGLKPSEMHEVDYCAYFDVAGEMLWKCSTPMLSKLGVGDTTILVSPTITTLLACTSQNAPRAFC